MQGYDADNPNVDLLRLKNFTIGRKLKDEEVAGSGFMDSIAGLVATMTPFVSLLHFLLAFDFVGLVAWQRGRSLIPSAFVLVSVQTAEKSPRPFQTDLDGTNMYTPLCPATHPLD